MNKIIILFCLVVSHNVMSSDSADVTDVTTKMQKLSVASRGAIPPVTDLIEFGALGEAIGQGGKEAQVSNKLAKKVVEFAGASVSHVEYCRYLFGQIQEGNGKNSARRSSLAFARRFGPRLKKWGKGGAVPGLARRVESHPRNLRYYQNRSRGPLTFDQLVSRYGREEDLEAELR